MHQAAEARAEGHAKAVDPVCGMTVDAGQAAGKYEYKGQIYYFCGRGCLAKFQSDPERYLRDKTSPPPTLVSLSPVPGTKRPHPASAAAGPTKLSEKATSSPNATTYTCPMDPEVRSPKPGSCPKCGMELEPVLPLARSRNQWVCPMHPEIVRSEAGSCPICGMALEPRTASLAQDENPELAAMTLWFWLSLVLSAPVLFLGMAG